MAPEADTTADMSLETAIEQAKRAFALQKYEQAVELYTVALEKLTQEVKDDAPELADLYFLYGKALLENAISQAGVLGKDQPATADEEEEGSSSKGPHRPILSFSGDGDDDPTIDLLNAPIDDEDEDEGEQGGEGDDDEPEDDFNAAWEILELAKAIYQKQLESGEDEEAQLKLADTFIALGDVSLETEKFDDAIGDYQSGLDLKVKLLPKSSRQIAEAHYKLSMVLDLTSGRLADAVGHVESALASVEARLSELRDGLGSAPATAPAPAEEKVDAKGKGKQIARLVRDNDVKAMSKAQIEKEINECEGLKNDLLLKIEEMKTAPAEGEQGSAPELAAKALDAELKGSSAAASVNPAVVNDLTSIVKKKKKVPAADNNGSKRKADEDAGSNEKKARLDEPMEH